VSRLLGRGRGEEEDKKAERSEPAPMQDRGAPEPPKPEPAEAPSERYRLEERDVGEAMAEDMDDELAEGAAPAQSMTQAGALPSNRAPGVVVSKKGETWIVEIMAAGSTKWEPGDRVTIVLADGTKVEATRVAEGSTRAMEVSAGTRIRLVLRLPAATEQRPVALELTNRGRSFTVAL